jgi:hypothetical protein
MTENHEGVGEGTVLLDIGGEIGALVVTTTGQLSGEEIEIRPTGATPYADPAGWSSADQEPHVHRDGTTHVHGASRPHLLHVAVHQRPDRTWSAVFPELHEGTYELYLRPDGPVRLSVTVAGGSVSTVTWPD